jgi:hypothetical protein
MPHVFDTGLAQPQRTIIVQSAVTLLAGLKRPAGYLNAVIDWGGVIRSYADDEGIDELWTALQGRNPAIAISLGDRVGHAGGLGGHKHVDELELLVYFMNIHPRSLEIGRQTLDAIGAASNTSDPGLHVMLAHAEELLVGQRCGNTAVIKQIRFAREVEVRTRNGFTLWCQHYAITADTQIRPFRTVTQMLHDIRTSLHSSGAPSVEIVATQDLTLQGVPVDATSNKRAPTTLLEWQAVASRAPRHAWGFQDVAGNVSPAIGSALVVAGTVDYQQTVTGWTRKGVRFSPTAGERATQAAGASVNAGATSVAWFGLVDLLATPAATGAVMFAAAGLTVRVNNTPRLEVVCDSLVVAGAVDPVAGGARPMLLVFDRSRQTVTLYTDQEVISGMYSPYLTDGEKGFGAVATPCDAAVLLGAAFEGAAAEFSEDDARDLFTNLGFTVPW